MEIFKDIEGYEGLYQVSNQGRVKSLDRTVLNGNRYINVKGKVLRPGTHVRGYLFVVLSKEGVEKPKTIHRLVGKCFVDNPKNKPEINHINGIKTDNNSSNLQFQRLKKMAT